MRGPGRMRLSAGVRSKPTPRPSRSMQKPQWSSRSLLRPRLPEPVRRPPTVNRLRTEGDVGGHHSDRGYGVLSAICPTAIPPPLAMPPISSDKIKINWFPCPTPAVSTDRESFPFGDSSGRLVDRGAATWAGPGVAGTRKPPHHPLELGGKSEGLVPIQKAKHARGATPLGSILHGEEPFPFEEPKTRNPLAVKPRKRQSLDGRTMVDGKSWGREREVVDWIAGGCSTGRSLRSARGFACNKVSSSDSPCHLVVPFKQTAINGC